MATKTTALRYAQDSANKIKATVVIYQCKNNQWLYTRDTEVGINQRNAEIVTPQADYNKFKSPRLLTSSEYKALSDLYNNCNDAYRTLSEEWKYAFIARLHSKTK